MFFGGFLHRSNYNRKKGAVVWPLVGMFGGSISLDCFGGFLNQITTGKKVQLSGHRLQCRIILVGLSLCFLAGSLIKIQITTRKKKVQSSGTISHSCLWLMPWKKIDIISFGKSPPIIHPHHWFQPSRAWGASPMVLGWSAVERIGVRRATGKAISHSRWPSWCAKIVQKKWYVWKLTWSGWRLAFYVPGLRYPFFSWSPLGDCHYSSKI